MAHINYPCNSPRHLWHSSIAALSLLSRSGKLPGVNSKVGGDDNDSAGLDLPLSIDPAVAGSVATLDLLVFGVSLSRSNDELALRKMDAIDGRLDDRELRGIRCEESGEGGGGGGLPRQVTKKLARPARDGCRRELVGGSVGLSDEADVGPRTSLNLASLSASPTIACLPIDPADDHPPPPPAAGDDSDSCKVMRRSLRRSSTGVPEISLLPPPTPRSTRVCASSHVDACLESMCAFRRSAAKASRLAINERSSAQR